MVIVIFTFKIYIIISISSYNIIALIHVINIHLACIDNSTILIIINKFELCPLQFFYEFRIIVNLINTEQISINSNTQSFYEFSVVVNLIKT